jgi:hypothetical protein
MKSILLCCHVGFVLCAYLVLGVSYVVLPKTFQISAQHVVAAYTVTILAALASLIGVASISMRRGHSESIALGVSTIAAFLLLFLGL